MAKYLGYRDGGKTNEEGLFKLISRLFSGGNPLTHTTTSMSVVQRGAGANMSVDVSVGDIHIPTLTGGYSYNGWIDAAENVTVSAADATNPRLDIVVAYVDLSIVSSAANNNPNALKFITVAGTPAGSPVIPTDPTIQTAVGAGNPWVRLSRLSVLALSTTVVNANITDLRTPISLNARLRGGTSNTSGHIVPNVADDTVALLAATQSLTGKTLVSPVISGFNAPQGFLLNGKIVTSVATNDITVAIKTLAGVDPTATIPVYVRIGDTVRAITSALSVTKLDGTNWFNSGAAETAAQELDYFVYLGYNATDGVVIGFARIPHARIYSDFSVTTTNDKYCAISTITTAASTDEYEVVGRFNAILSATAAFNWSLPATSIIVNRPIFETRWLPYIPTWAALTVGNGTSASRFCIVDRIVYFTIKFTLGATSTVGSGPSYTLPITSAAVSNNPVIGLAAYLDSGVGSYNSISQHLTTTTASLVVSAATGSYVQDSNVTAAIPFAWGTSDVIMTRGFYEVA